MKSTAAKNFLVPSAASVKVASSSTRRTALTFSAFRSNSGVQITIALRTGGPFTSMTDPAICLFLAGIPDPVTLTIKEHGDIIQREWHALSTNTFRQLIVTETFEDDD